MRGVAEFRLELLGEPASVRRGGAAINLTSRKSLALLAYLAMNRGQAPTRDRLVDLFWGERFEQQARQSLRQAVYGLRRALDAGEREPIVASGETVSIDATMFAVDAWDFERLAASDAPADLEAAARLYRGPLLGDLHLRDTGFSVWLDIERARLRELAWQALYRLAKHRKSHGQDAEALAIGRRLLDLDSIREKAHRLVMRILAKQGERAQALQHYHRLTELLREELDVEPDLMTMRLYEEIKAAAEADRPVTLADEPDEAEEKPAAALKSERFFSPLRPAVVVLPFKNVGDDPGLDYLAQGIADDITTGLSCWRWFPVIGTNSSRFFSSGGADLAEIGRQLDARYAVTGSVRPSAQSLRIRAELTDLLTHHNLWSGRYDVKFNEMLAVQDDIAEKIVTSIEPHVERAEQERSLRKSDADMTAWDRVMRAGWHRSGLTRSGNATAIALLEEAVKIDPDLSIAWANLSQCRWNDAILGWTENAQRSFEESDRCARRALTLDDLDWLAHAMAGLNDMWMRRDYESSIERINRAVEMNPSSSTARHSAACSLEFAGRPEEALSHLRVIMRLDPRYSNNAAMLADMSLCYLQLGQFDDAAIYGRKAMAVRPDYTRAYPRFAAAAAHLGQVSDARAALDALAELQPGFCEAYVRETYPFRDPRHLDVLLGGLGIAGLPKG
jgi:DNA-binding SARP family transcriptional activator/Flp pilus assembly protein TadD